MMELKFMIRYRYRLQTPILSKDNCKNIVSNIKYFLKTFIKKEIGDMKLFNKDEGKPKSTVPIYFL